MATRLLICSQSYRGTSPLLRTHASTFLLLHQSPQRAKFNLKSPLSRSVFPANRLPLPIPPIRARSQQQDRDGVPANLGEPGILLRLQSTSLFVLAGVYVLWLFILPYAPGDPVWAIKPDTIKMILDLSLNFLYILPLTNWLGFHLLESPVLHPTAEALFNFVIGWSVLFAPLLFTDRRSDRFEGSSLVLLWGVQMFLTNTVLIPYMAIRLQQEPKSKKTSAKRSGIQEIITTPNGAKFLSAMGGVVGLVSVWWFFSGRPDESFGSLTDRWAFFLEYLASDRLGYAFIWDICLYSVFQPWLIGDNLDDNIMDRDDARLLNVLRFVPYIGLVAYLWKLAENPNMLREEVDPKP